MNKKSIAFQLGEFKFNNRFYSLIGWKINQEPFELHEYFDWKLDYVDTVNWTNTTFWGYIRFEKLETLSDKLDFIRGNISRAAKRKDDNTLYFGWANSYDIRDFVASSLSDIITQKFPQETFYIKKSETIGTCPGTPFAELITSQNVIDYILSENP